MAKSATRPNDSTPGPKALPPGGFQISGEEAAGIRGVVLLVSDARVRLSTVGRMALAIELSKLTKPDVVALQALMNPAPKEPTDA